MDPHPNFLPKKGLACCQAHLDFRQPLIDFREALAARVLGVSNGRRTPTMIGSCWFPSQHHPQHGPNCMKDVRRFRANGRFPSGFLSKASLEIERVHAISNDIPSQPAFILGARGTLDPNLHSSFSQRCLSVLLEWFRLHLEGQPIQGQNICVEP